MDGMGPRVKKIPYDPKSPQEKDLINMHDKEKIRPGDIKFGVIAIGGLLLIILATVIAPWFIGNIVDLMDEDEDDDEEHRSRLVVGDLVNQGPDIHSPAYYNARSFIVYITNKGPGAASDVVASFTVEYFNETSLIGKTAVTERMGLMVRDNQNPVTSDIVPADAHYYIITLDLSWNDGSLTYTWTE